MNNWSSLRKFLVLSRYHFNALIGHQTLSSTMEDSSESGLMKISTGPEEAV